MEKCHEIQLTKNKMDLNKSKMTKNNITHMVFESELAVKLHAKDVEVGTSSDRNPKQDQITMGRADSPGSTNHKSLSFVRIQYHAPVITLLLNPSQVNVKGGCNSRFVCCLANNCQLCGILCIGKYSVLNQLKDFAGI